MGDAAEPATAAPPFGEAWRRVHHRIQVYLKKEEDFFHVRLLGPANKELLDLNISYHAKAAHGLFYQDFLEYLLRNLHNVDRSPLSEPKVMDLENSLIGLVAICKSDPLQLPESVVRELFRDVDAENASRGLEKKRLDEEAERLLAERECLDERLNAAKRRRANLDGAYYSSDSE